ncbi:MAG: cupin domain-containing protein [Acidimicrobiia bacterium]
MHSNWDEMTVELEVGDIHTRGEEWGDITVRNIDLPAGADLRPLLAGLPDDRCACPHWGYVLEGSITLAYADGTEEVTRAGELYFWPGGHTAWTVDGVKFVEFSPADEIRPVLEHLGAQLGAAV